MEENILRLEPKLKLVYVWQQPVRIYHWVNVLAVFVLVVTGYLIGAPLAIQSGAEASFNYWYGTIRFLHFAAGYLFFFNFIFRLYWGFVGNEYAKWDNYIPYKKSHWVSIWNVLKVDIFQLKLGPYDTVGHNSLASFSYFITFIAFVLQSLTGFGLYAAMSPSWFPKLFAWFVPLVGGDLAARNLHHILMWVFILFTMVHVYLVFYHDYVERNGVTSSMIGGWKFIEVDKEEKES
jgi:Ni/Fe-hydrogenase 1 B-type cytochrome subunit